MKNEVKVRKTWGEMSPVSRIHGNGKESRKPKFNKARRNDWKRDLSY